MESDHKWVTWLQVVNLWGGDFKIVKLVFSCPNPVDPYQVVFHEVWTDSRVKFPSHLKRFEVQMFAFDGQDDMNSQVSLQEFFVFVFFALAATTLELKLFLNEQVFVHCDAVICDTKIPLGGICTGQCPNPDDGTKGKVGFMLSTF